MNVMIMENKVLEIMKAVFGVESIDRTCSQKNCEKWDSMAQLNLIVELETAFDISIEPEEIGSMRTFDEVCGVIKKKLS